MVASAMVGRNLAHATLLERLSKIARTNPEVLITGPTGVGKELYAVYVHQHSCPRRTQVRGRQLRRNSQ